MGVAQVLAVLDMCSVLATSVILVRFHRCIAARYKWFATALQGIFQRESESTQWHIDDVATFDVGSGVQNAPKRRGPVCAADHVVLRTSMCIFN